MKTRSAAMRVDRRDFLKATAVAAGVATLGRGAIAAAAPVTAGAGELIDTNVYLSRWPLGRLPHDDTAALAAKLRAAGVTQAWAGSFDSLLHRDIATVNTRLAEECRRHGGGLLVPFGAINPQLPDWEEDLRRCVEVERMPGIRLHPNYHGYTLDHPECARLLRLAAERGLIVQIVLVMEDERMMHPMLRAVPTDTKALVGIVRQTPGLRLMLLNSQRTLRGPALAALLAAGEVSVDLAMLEGVNGLASLLAGGVPMERVLFGSFAPMFYFESAALKLQESPLSEPQRAAIRSGNARRLLAAGR